MVALSAETRWWRRARSATVASTIRTVMSNAAIRGSQSNLEPNHAGKITKMTSENLISYEHCVSKG